LSGSFRWCPVSRFFRQVLLDFSYLSYLLYVALTFSFRFDYAISTALVKRKNYETVGFEKPFIVLLLLPSCVWKYFPRRLNSGTLYLMSSDKVRNEVDVHRSVHRNINLIERTNKMRPYSRIYYFSVSKLLNMFCATHRPSSRAQKL
jgi:hypothetical protein